MSLKYLLPFCSVLLSNIETATISPPDGLVLYTMKAADPHHSMGEIYRASIPFVIIDLVAMAIIMIFRDIALFLPSIAKRLKIMGVEGSIRQGI